MFIFPALNVRYLLFDSNPFPSLLNSFDIKDANLACTWSKALRWTPVVFVYLGSFFSPWDPTAPPSATTSLGKCSPTHSSHTTVLALSTNRSTPPFSPKVWLCDPGLTHPSMPSFPGSQGLVRVGRWLRPESTLFPRTLLCETKGRKNKPGAKGGNTDQKKMFQGTVMPSRERIKPKIKRDIQESRKQRYRQTDTCSSLPWTCVKAPRSQ